MIKVVVDTNIIISSIFWSGKPYKFMNNIIKRKIEGYISKEILDEIEIILNGFRYKLPESKKKEIINKIAYIFNLIKPKKKHNVIKEHEIDNIFIDCAIEGKTDYIITGDSHLLKLKKFKNIEILTVNEFLKKFKK